jgi:AraC-like DNA-binding protein
MLKWYSSVCSSVVYLVGGTGGLSAGGGYALMLYMTDQGDDNKRFEYWQELVCRAFVPFDCRRLSDRHFSGKVECTEFGPYRVSRVHCIGHEIERTPSRIRQGCPETLLISLQTSNTGILIQDGREAVLHAGDVALYESVRPFTWSYQDEFEQIVLLVPRDEITKRICQPEQFTARKIDASSGVGELATSFIRQCFPMIGGVEPEMAQRLSQISMDLLATALVGLTAHQGAAKSNRTAIQYRAKQLIRENLGNPELNSECVAAMLHISVRYLQDLFQDDGGTVNDWIWRQRLEECRRRLADPFFVGAGISQIAFDCGFSNFSHFSHRFKAAFLVSPSEYRTAQRNTPQSPK